MQRKPRKPVAQVNAFVVEFEEMDAQKGFLIRLAWLSQVCLLPCYALSPGFQNAATNGGGLALPDNVASIFGNPAAVSQPRQSSGEAGVYGITSNESTPWAGWLSPAGREASLGIGLQEPDLGAIDQHFIQGTGVSRIFVGTWIGARASMQKTPTATNLDFSIGGLHRLGPHLGIGWMADQVTTSLSTHHCDDCGERQFGLGLSWFFDRNNRFAAFGDLRRSEEILGPYSTYSPSLGTRLIFGPNQNFQFLLTAQKEGIQKESMLSISSGIKVQQYFLSTLVNASYALSALPVQHGHGSGPWHQFSVGLVWDAFADHTDPQPFVRSTHAQISPGGVEDLPRGLDFLMRVTENSGKLEEWSLVIYTAPAHMKPEQLVRRYSGRGMPPATIYWSADDVAGYPCNPGLYAYRLIVSDMAGNRAWTEWQHVEIR